MNRENLFEKESIPKLMIKMCIPAIISILIMIIYNMADMFFIGKTGDAMQVAAISLSAPIFSILSAIGTLIGGGGCTAIAVALGKKNTEKAKSMTVFCFYASLVIGFGFTIIILLGIEPILNVIGTSEMTRAFTKDYLQTIFLGAPIILFSSVSGNIVRANGASKESMFGNLLGSLTNIVLDPIFILAFGLGVKGAAIATIIGYTLSSIYFVIYFRKHRDSFSFKLKHLSFKPDVSWKILYLGLPTALGVVLMSVSNIFTNNILVSYGDAAVAASGIAGRISMVIGMLQMGICMGIQPALAYSHGARNLARMKEIIKTTAIVTITLGTALTILGWIFKGPLVVAFVNDAQVLHFGQRMIIGNLIAGPVIGLFYLSTGYLQSIEKAGVATFTSLLRQGIVYIPVLLIMNATFELNGIIFSHAIADILSTGVAVLICASTYRGLVKQKDSNV
ncbi:MAG: MATE family efflux transporter [Suipraeoptans sp.]